jgi:hypothetical protein
MNRVKPAQKGHIGKQQLTSEQKIGGAVQMCHRKQSLEHREFFAAWIVKN